MRNILPPRLVDALTLLLSDPAHGSIYLFADPSQAGHTSWLCELEVLLPPQAKVGLDCNCRNTRQICSLVADLFSRPVESSDIEGPEVKFLVAQTSEEAVKLVRREAEYLLDGGLPPNSVAVLYDQASWYKYLWEKPDFETDNIQHKGWPDAYSNKDTEGDLIWYNGPFAPLDLDNAVAAELDDNFSGYYTYYLRRRTTLELVPREGHERSVRCLHLESAIGLEFDAVILLLAPSTLELFELEDVTGVDPDMLLDILQLSDDDGFDTGVWLKTLSGPDAITARAYVGITRARTWLTIIGSDQAMAPFSSSKRKRGAGAGDGD
jgi:superfamily I DNA/RNA helicase